MSIDWKNFERQSKIAAKRASARTNDKLASRISSVTTLKDEEIKKLFPKSADVERLAELLAIVKSSKGQNTKVKQLKDNIEGLAGIIVKLVGKLV